MAGPEGRGGALHLAHFVAIPAYEFWLVANVGEINTYGVPDLPPKMEFLGPDRLGSYQDWLAQRGGVGQFNHPIYVTHDFKDYAGLSATRDGAMGVIEVYNDVVTEASYVKALDAGWHVMPSANSDTHEADWIAGSDVRTVLLAGSLTPADLYAAMRAQRGYATLDKNLGVRFSVNGGVMGSTLTRSPAYSAEVRVGTRTPSPGARASRDTRGDRLRRRSGGPQPDAQPRGGGQDRDLDGDGTARAGEVLLGAREHRPVTPPACRE